MGERGCVRSGKRRERERGLNGYILISFVHPQKLLSVPPHCSRMGRVLGLVSLREKKRRRRTQAHAVCKYFRAESLALIRRGTRTRARRFSEFPPPRPEVPNVATHLCVSTSFHIRRGKCVLTRDLFLYLCLSIFFRIRGIRHIAWNSRNALGCKGMARYLSLILE